MLHFCCVDLIAATKAHRKKCFRSLIVQKLSKTSSITSTWSLEGMCHTLYIFVEDETHWALNTLMLCITLLRERRPRKPLTDLLFDTIIFFTS